MAHCAELESIIYIYVCVCVRMHACVCDCPSENRPIAIVHTSDFAKLMIHRIL